MVDVYCKLVGKYTSPMHPMGIGIKHWNAVVRKTPILYKLIVDSFFWGGGFGLLSRCFLAAFKSLKFREFCNSSWWFQPI